VNNAYRERLAEHGLRFSGLSPDNNLVEIIEQPGHPWYLGCQFHPELKSRPMRPHPLFTAFIRAAKQRARVAGRIEAGQPAEAPNGTEPSSVHAPAEA
jgi:CTP synthase